MQLTSPLCVTPTSNITSRVIGFTILCIICGLVQTFAVPQGTRSAVDAANYMIFHYYVHNIDLENCPVPLSLSLFLFLSLSLSLSCARALISMPITRNTRTVRRVRRTRWIKMKTYERLPFFATSECRMQLRRCSRAKRRDNLSRRRARNLQSKSIIPATRSPLFAVKKGKKRKKSTSPHARARTSAGGKNSDKTRTVGIAIGAPWTIIDLERKGRKIKPIHRRYSRVEGHAVQ